MNRKKKNVYQQKLICIIFAVAVICIIVGILIGKGIGKNESEASAQTVNASVTVSDTTETTVPRVDKDEWNLILVNKWNPIPDGYEVKLTKLKNGLSVDERCYPDLQKMMDDCRADGLEPVICSAYRTQEKQESLFERQIGKWKDKGYSDEEAKIKAGELVAVPGTSEHQLGLALDIVDNDYQLLDEEQEHTAVQQWLMNNSWKYGFILRYPTDKREITGITYEPWHYRYVGVDNAKAVYESGLCLEEFLEAQ